MKGSTWANALGWGRNHTYPIARAVEHQRVNSCWNSILGFATQNRKFVGWTFKHGCEINSNSQQSFVCPSCPSTKHSLSSRMNHYEFWRIKNQSRKEIKVKLLLLHKCLHNWRLSMSWDIWMNLRSVSWCSKTE